MHQQSIIVCLQSGKSWIIYFCLCFLLFGLQQRLTLALSLSIRCVRLCWLACLLACVLRIALFFVYHMYLCMYGSVLPTKDRCGGRDVVETSDGHLFQDLGHLRRGSFSFRLFLCCWGADFFCFSPSVMRIIYYCVRCYIFRNKQLAGTIYYIINILPAAALWFPLFSAIDMCVDGFTDVWLALLNDRR